MSTDGSKSHGDLSGRVAVITGGGQGIGRSIALEMARAGASVAVAARSRDALAEVRAELEGIGAEALDQVCDVAQPADTERLAAAATERFGHVDCVVACAGIAGAAKPMHEITPEEWRECVAVDLDGVYLTFRPFIEPMIERRSGRLIAISSMTGKRPLPNRTPYAASKLGVIGIVRSLAAELGPYGITVNSVVPGATAGPRLDRVAKTIAESEGITEAEALERFTADSPLRRAVEPEEVAGACTYLASDAAAGITGEDLNVTAGLVMY